MFGAPFRILNLAGKNVPATSMEMIQRQPELLQKEPSARRPAFPKRLFEGGKFIDPEKEAQLLLPEQVAASSQVLDAVHVQPFSMQKGKESVLASLYDYLVGWLAHMKKRFAKNRRARARLTRAGERALEQLRYLSALCEATSCRGNEEVLLAESAFGEAYYEIMTLSANLEKMSQAEEGHHVRRYCRQMAKVIQAAD